MSRPSRPTVLHWAAVIVSATGLLCAASTAQARPSSSASPSAVAATAASVSTAGINVNSPSDTGASDLSDLGSAGWAVQSSAIATQSGAQISTPGFSTSTWLPVTNDDAGAPGTEIEALAQNGLCPGDIALQPVNQGTSGSSSSSSVPSLTIASPQVWWPYQMGAQPLYTLATSVSQNGTVLNSTSETFGIRNVTSYLTSGTSKGAPNGARAFKINGVPIVIRGGGFSPNTSSSTVAFLLRADVRRGTSSGQELSGDNELQSSIWQDNDITLFPGESQTLTVTYDSSDLQGATPVISVSGWNVPKIDIAAPVP